MGWPRVLKIEQNAGWQDATEVELHLHEDGSVTWAKIVDIPQGKMDDPGPRSTVYPTAGSGA